MLQQFLRMHLVQSDSRMKEAAGAALERALQEKPYQAVMKMALTRYDGYSL